MAYKIIIDDKALNELANLPRKIQRQITNKIDNLSSDPRPAGCKIIQQDKSLYRIRSGDYRIVYQIREKQVLVLVVSIGHRKDIYRKL
jgi:mRNA interferase RelE/StbE